MPFLLGSQLSCLTTLETYFQIAIDKPILHQKANFYKGKELMIEDDEDVSPIKFVKAQPGHLFKHELEALQ